MHIQADPVIGSEANRVVRIDTKSWELGYADGYEGVVSIARAGFEADSYHRGFVEGSNDRVNDEYDGVLPRGQHRSAVPRAPIAPDQAAEDAPAPRALYPLD